MSNSPRVMWLLNHTAARKFELAMLKKLGFNEVFLPKNFPQDIGFRSASIETSEDAFLSIPSEDLDLLNQQDWYGEPSRDAWLVANRHFDLIFCIARPELLRFVARQFRGAAILRAYGLAKGNSYGEIIGTTNERLGSVENMGRRFWLGTAYEGLAEQEAPWMQSREVYLPIGLQNCQILDRWTGEDARIFFICPDVEGIPYYRQIYLDFKKQFSGLPYAIGGAQALATSNPHVLGYVPDAEHQRNMREFRVMYYHSTEPNHIHYHPFEAVRAGMPLVFLAGGMLDKLGGSALPGRCRGVAEARAKLSRILAGDQDLIGKIRASQPVLLEKMRPAGLESAWRAGLDRVLSELERSRVARPAVTRRPRIGVVVPLNYRGGTLRSAKLLAEAIGRGSRQFSEDADVVFAYPAEAKDEQTADRWDVGLPSFVSKRTIAWHVLDPDSAQRAMRYAGHAGWVAVAERYMVPDDRREYLLDCDLWIIVSDRISIPLLPIRPYLMVVYDYIQRYEHQDDTDAAFLAAAKRAQRVLVTTRFTEQDALTYAGIPRERLFRVPMLVPDFIPGQTNLAAPKTPYFLWTTNRGRHKNHYNAFCALREYYELADGKLRCRVTGVESESLLRGGAAHLEPLKGIVAQSPKLARQLRIVGELSDAAYRKMLAGSCFLWHPAQIDNGTLAAVEAAMIGVPTLSSRYPAMEEMQEHFDLRLKWMDSTNPSEMAQGLKWMEEHLTATRAEAASRQEPVGSSAERSAAAYWKVIRECL